MAAPFARVAGSVAGVQLTGGAPTGRPVTLHVAFVATSGPRLVQVAVAVPVAGTGVPAGALGGKPLTSARMLARDASWVGVTAAEGAEAGPVPAELFAWTVNVYAMSFCNPSNE